MPLTYGDMQDRIEAELHRDDLISGNYAQNAIKAAIKHYERERWYFNEEVATTVTVAGTASYSLPSDFMAMDSVKVTVNGSKLRMEPMTFQEMDARDDGSASTRGVPQWWCIYENQLRLYPVPDAVYTITESYQKRLTELSADADTNAWVDDLEELIRCKAMVNIAMYSIRDFELANALMPMLQIAYQNAREQNERLLFSGRKTAHYLG